MDRPSTEPVLSNAEGITMTHSVEGRRPVRTSSSSVQARVKGIESDLLLLLIILHKHLLKRSLRTLECFAQ